EIVVNKTLRLEARQQAATDPVFEMDMHGFRPCFAVRAGERLAEVEDPRILEDNRTHRTPGIPCAHFLSPPARGPQAVDRLTPCGVLLERCRGEVVPTRLGSLDRFGGQTSFDVHQPQCAIERGPEL